MNNYNCTHGPASQTVPEGILSHGLMMVSKPRVKEYTDTRQEKWRRRWLSQPVNKENQEQKWRRQGKLQ
ncbi:hypothetical protein [Endozoicomonas sp. Mp262]|uniref:hypothetical protein n=1 Tax=Endozoicomonas sp. Mp262 TaxID=2919499 RepID=UPI0021D8DACE